MRQGSDDWLQVINNKPADNGCDIVRQEVNGIMNLSDWPLHLLPNVKPVKRVEAPISAMYWLFNGDEMVYVGVTTELKKRLRAHRSHKDFDKWSYMPMDINEALQHEDILLRTFKPKYNIRPIHS